MGNATIWWWPVGSTTVEEIDLGRTFSDLTFDTARNGTDSVSAYGRSTRYDRGGYRRVRISKERIQNNAALVRDLEALVRHLQSGGLCAASLDKAKTFGTWSDGPVLPGGTTVRVSPGVNAFARLNPSAALSSGDEIMIESPNPEYLLDVNTFSSLSAGTITTGENIRTGFELSPCFVRYRYFYPALRLPISAASDPGLLSHDRLLNWTLSLPLVERPGDIEALRTGAQLLAGSEPLTDALTIEAILRTLEPPERDIVGRL